LNSNQFLLGAGTGSASRTHKQETITLSQSKHNYLLVTSNNTQAE